MRKSRCGVGRQLVGVPVARRRVDAPPQGGPSVPCSHDVHAVRRAARRPALVVDAGALEHNLDDDGRRAPRRALPSAREGAQEHRARPAPARRRPRRLHVRDAARDGRAGRRGSRRRPAARQRGRRPASASARWPSSTRASPSRSTPTRRSTRRRAAGLRECLVDVNVGMPRCGCPPDDAGRSPTRAARAGSTVRGVMGYEGHVVGVVDRARARAADGRRRWRSSPRRTTRSVATIVSGGRHRHVRHQHARHRDPGRLVRADGHRLRPSSTLPFRPALSVLATVISRQRRATASPSPTAGSRRSAWTTATRRSRARPCWFCSDEHVDVLDRRRRAAPGGRRPRARVARARRPDRRVPRADARRRRTGARRAVVDTLGGRPPRLVTTARTVPPASVARPSSLPAPWTGALALLDATAQAELVRTGDAHTARARRRGDQPHREGERRAQRGHPPALRQGTRHAAEASCRRRPVPRRADRAQGSRRRARRATRCTSATSC